ncbi:MAG TPA: M23 family metallopeptidase, partial [Elusimicrobiales bacterium]|nr:M23 family metallopeptidase [Elusimicrobiales bacterium]
MTESLVREGDAVKRGQRIGLMGTTGTSTGSHVHYEVLEGGVPKNPERYFNAGGKTTFFAGVFEGLTGRGR